MKLTFFVGHWSSRWPMFTIASTTRYDYNLTIMKFPKPAIDNRFKNKLKATFEIEQCWIFAVLWWPFRKWRLVEIFRYWESIQDVEIEQRWICLVLWRPFWKWRQVEIFRCQESIRDIIIYLHMKCRWNRTMLNLCGIVVAILKMATGRNFRHQESIWDIIIHPHMKWRWNQTMLNLCGIVAAILKMATGRNFSMTGINSGHHYLPTYQILMISDNVEFLRYCGGHFENGDR